MRNIAVSRRKRYLQLGVPAAVLGTLASALASVPATAAEVPALRPADGPQGATRLVPSQGTPSSVVQPGDTVIAIAERHGVRAADILSWNGMTWRTVIYPGQKLSLGPAPSAAPAPATPTPAASGATHVVAAGDTVFAIAQRLGVTADAILAANGLTRASVIYPGQTLTLGTASAPAAAPAPAATPAPAQASGGQSHVVAAGDTLFAIARKYGVTVQTLSAANGLSGSSIIYPGQSLVVSAPAPAAAPAAPAPSSPAPATAPTPSTARLDAEQAANAAAIIAVGRELGVSDRGIAIALATGMVESWLRNLDWGDRDSLGLFQQRPSTGWGTPAQVRDAERSIRAFYGGPADPNGETTRGLLDIPGWEGMTFTDAAQAVQISAYPERYGQWEAQAYEWLALHG